MIGKLITIAQTRQEAIQTMYRALSEYVIEGIKTTIPFHLQLMQDERFRSGDFNTKFLDNFTLK
jgi:acetyl-CoA carboxylase biotin carboxylase subunit